MSEQLEQIEKLVGQIRELSGSNFIKKPDYLSGSAWSQISTADKEKIGIVDQEKKAQVRDQMSRICDEIFSTVDSMISPYMIKNQGSPGTGKRNIRTFGLNASDPVTEDQVSRAISLFPGSRYDEGTKTLIVPEPGTGREHRYTNRGAAAKPLRGAGF